MLINKTIIGSQLNKYLKSGLGSVGEYNSNNQWNFNGNNRNLNNNNRYNSNFRSRPCSDYITTGEQSVNQYTIQLEDIQLIEESCKSTKSNCVIFRINKIHNIVDIWHKINNKNVKITTATVFSITIPKLREIIYCNYSDKLVQSCYVFSLKSYLEQYWFDFDSYSCRTNKGVLKAVNAYREYMKFASDNFTNNEVYLASLDIKRFFNNIDCKLLAEKMCDFINKNLKEHPNKEMLLYLTKCLYIIDWHSIEIKKACSNDYVIVPPDRSLLSSDPYIGAPIGNWPSQVGGNFITTFALIFIRGLGYKYLIHYTDDTSLVILDKNKYLKDIPIIEQYYKEVLHLELHKNKRYLQHISKGITFLGRRIKFDRCIASKRTISSINILVNNICIKNKRYIKNNCESISQSINSYFGMLIHMTMYNYRKDILIKIEENLGNYFCIDKEKYNKITVKPEFTLRNRYINNKKKRINNEKIW